jgi:hypothetical protein
METAYALKAFEDGHLRLDKSGKAERIIYVSANRCGVLAGLIKSRAGQEDCPTPPTADNAWCIVHWVL